MQNLIDPPPHNDSIHKDKLQAELNKLVKRDAIRKVEEHTVQTGAQKGWISAYIYLDQKS